MPDVQAMRTDARRNRQRLLDIAHEVFREHGVSASLEEVARRAGVGIGTLYRHFPTREALILALVADDLERLAGLAEELSGDADPDGVERWLEALIRHNITYRGLAETLVAAVGEPNLLGESCARLHSAGAALVSNGQQQQQLRADIDPTDAVDLAVALAWITEADPDDRRRQRLLHILIGGLSATAPTS